MSALSSQAYWDRYWQGTDASGVSMPKGPVGRAIAEVFESFVGDGGSVIEIGGAPGRYLGFLAEEFACEATALDYSTEGCRATHENFLRLGHPVDVIECDLFEFEPKSLYDTVLSLGFVEHFAELDRVLERHVALVKDDGNIIVGVPNFPRFLRPVIKALRPETYGTHNLEAMSASSWVSIAERLDLRLIYQQYVGGVSLAQAGTAEGTGFVSSILAKAFAVTHQLAQRFFGGRNSEGASPYLLMVFEKAS